jgi:hypothetical protein
VTGSMRQEHPQARCSAARLREAKPEDNADSDEGEERDHEAGACETTVVADADGHLALDRADPRRHGSRHGGSLWRQPPVIPPYPQRVTPPSEKLPRRADSKEQAHDRMGVRIPLRVQLCWSEAELV